MTENTDSNAPETARTQRRDPGAAKRPAARRSKPHPAHQARRIAGLSSVAGMLVLTGVMAAGTTATSSTAAGATNTSVAGTATGATTATKSTSSATAATTATTQATTQAVTKSSGS